MTFPMRGLEGRIEQYTPHSANRAQRILERVKFGDTSQADIDWLRSRNELPEGTFMSMRKMCRQIINKRVIREVTARLKK